MDKTLTKYRNFFNNSKVLISWRYSQFWDLKIFEVTRRYMQLFTVVSS
jgi:hypothetical protein